jgi:ankyrin repeat protein
LPNWQALQFLTGFADDTFAYGVVSGELRDCAALDPALADIDGQDEKTDHTWHWNQLKDQAHAVWFLIWNGADVTARTDTHSTPLHLVSSKRSAETVDILVQHGSDVNATDANQSTPLHLAASSRLALEGTIVHLLLQHGANVDAKDSEGRTPLDVAFLEGNSWIAKLLSDHQARRG